MAKGERESWRKVISKKLEIRDRNECCCFKDVVREHNKLFENAHTAKSRVVQLEIYVAQLQQEKLELQGRIQELSAAGGGGGAGSSGGSEKAAALEQKLFKLQEELTELHRQKGENAQKLMELNKQLTQKDQEMSVKEGQLQDLAVNKEAVDKESQGLQQTIVELDATCQMVKDELQALQLAYTSLEDKYRTVQRENRDLIERWMALKSKDADRVNLENESQQRARQVKMQQQLADAAKEVNVPKFDSSEPAIPFCAIISVPSFPEKKFDAHDGDVNAARFSISGRLFVTGGADTRVNIWEQSNLNYVLKGTMHGCNAGVMSVQVDPQEKLVLAASHDRACRVWTLGDQRLRHTLTGHSQKVMSAKFLGGATKVVSGGHDRTLKIWDLRSKACIRTIFAGSSCNDIVINEGVGQVISGHLDKTVRFWDVRAENQSSVGEITLQGKITSLDLSQDMNYALASARDDTIKLLDLRMNQVMSTCSADGFKVAMDHTRASFSPDGQYVICGSQDGSIFVWVKETAKLEKTLKEHSSSVVVCAWHPDGSSIISCDRNKHAIIWTNRY